ncbi:hypothetical protein JCM10207_005999 [Rhodosporidiobolus poonsookiae]
MTTTPDSRPTPSAVPPPRVIPGLSSASLPAPPKPRKRPSKKAGAGNGPTLVGTVAPANGTGEEEQAKGDAIVEEGKQHLDAVTGQDEDLTVEEKKTSPTEVVTKRLRAATKKLQRVQQYEESKTPLNADQQRAVAGKPVLEAIIRELNELLVVLKAEEEEDEARNKRVAIVEEKKQNKAIEAAVKASKADSQSSLVLLFQFLHLHSLFVPSTDSFAPPVLPPVIASATGQDAAAVRMLFDSFANGPLLGGDGDATEQLEKIAKGSEESCLGEVTFARIQQLIHGLTAPPEDVPSSPLEHDVESSEPARPTDSVVALVDGDQGDPPHPAATPTAASAGITSGVSFLQASEIDQPAPPPPAASFAAAPGAERETAPAQQQQPAVNALPTQPTEEKVAHWAEDVVHEAAVPPPSGPVTPAADTDLGAIGTPTGPSAATPMTETAPKTAPAALDWAADDGDDELPHLPELAPPVPVLPASNGAAAAPAAAGSPAPTVSSDGFQPARPSRRGSHQGQGEGRGRGGGRGRGSFRGRGRGGQGQGFQGERGERAEGGERPPRPERNGSGEGGSFRGRGRGGRGRGRGAAANGQVTNGPAPTPTA